MEVGGKKAVRGSGRGLGTWVSVGGWGRQGRTTGCRFLRCSLSSPGGEEQGGAAALGAPYPHSGLGEVGPHSDLFARAHVRVAVPLEGSLQLLQLLAGEVCALPTLLLLQRAVFGRAAGQRSRSLLGVWGQVGSGHRDSRVPPPPALLSHPGPTPIGD